MDRRNFIKNSAYSVVALRAMGLLRPDLVMASGPQGNGKILIMLNLPGGVDGLSAYPLLGQLGQIVAGRRPTLKVEENTILPIVNGAIGLHPSLAAIHPLHAAGNIKLISGIGTPGLNGFGSHDREQNKYSLGAEAPSGSGSRKGIWARLIDVNGLTSHQVIGITSSGLKLDFQGTEHVPPVFSELNTFNFGQMGNPLGGSNEGEHLLAVHRALLQLPSDRTGIELDLRNTQAQIHENINWAQDVAALPVGNYDTTQQIGRNFRDAAKIIKDMANRNDRGSTIIYLEAGGFDTHTNQLATLGPRLEPIFNAVATFVQDMKAFGKWNDVVINAYSEFGRTIPERVSDQGPPGTDHGRGGTQLVIGGQVNGAGANALCGDLPTAAELQGNNSITYKVDYRNVLAELINYIGYSPEPILDAVQPYTKRALGIMA